MPPGLVALTICSEAMGTGLMKLSGKIHFAGSKVPTDMSLQELVRLVVKENAGSFSDIASRRTARS